MTKYYIAGHRGMVGGAIARQLRAAGETDIVTRTHAELDLTNQLAVRDFMQAERPDVVSSPRQKLAAYMPITPTPRSSFTKT